MWIKYRNGKKHWLSKKVVRGYDGKEIRINEQYYDVFGVLRGRVERFVDDNVYLYAVIKGNKIDIDELYIE